jgi:hypothetical protein
MEILAHKQKTYPSISKSKKGHNYAKEANQSYGTCAYYVKLSQRTSV